MQVDYHKFFSPQLNQDFEIKSYGHEGRPVLVFPSQDGRFFDFENFGMVDAVSRLIREGTVRLFAIDGRDWETWSDPHKHPRDRARRQSEYDAAVLHDIVPFVRKQSRQAHERDLIVTGVSMGAYHAVNFFLRHPEVANSVIAMSGVYQLRSYIGEYMDDEVYFHSPLHYLANLTDERLLEQYRDSRIVLCCGQGRWEEQCLADTRHLSGLLRAKGVDHWLDLWGYDVDHDWPWWQKQLPYFLEQVV